MDYFSTTEIVGYVASLVVLISFLMRNVKRLRIVNTTGCLVFIIYGILLGWSIPIIITNAAIVIINVYYLIKMEKIVIE
tara:strand:- start:1158 stop:1394 length:237 start_codon:yes stop_codon:yes gene_type:complete